MRAVIYARVSTEERGNKGYSLRQQLQVLREYCQQNKYEIVGEFEDRASGASLDRLGLDALRDAVSADGVDVVLAQDRDRLSREPAHLYILREELHTHGTTLRALNDRGDNTPEGELTDGVFDQFAKYERAKTMERTRRGKLRKAQEGKVVGTGTPPYGFYYADNHYHIHPERMPYVHEIFERAAAGDSLCSIERHLNSIGAPTRREGKWSNSTIRGIIENDVYTGTAWWGRDRVTTRTVSVVDNGAKIYRRKFTKEERPRSEWIGVPVPDSGVPPETIARARESLEGNTRSVSKNDGRVWELSGGVGVCADCGRRMVGYTTLNPSKKHYHYNRCSGRGPYICDNRKNYRAGELETIVKNTLVETFQPETWTAFVNDLCDRELQDLRRLGRSTPKETLVGRMKALETKLDRARELFIDGDLPRPSYEEKRDVITDEIEVIRGSWRR